MNKYFYIIEDWGGNHLFSDKTFQSFDDGFAFLQERFEDYEIEDYYVIEKLK